MSFNLNDKLILTGIECHVAFINAKGQAYLVPEDEGDLYRGSPVLKGVVFAKIFPNSLDEYGNRAMGLPSLSGAV